MPKLSNEQIRFLKWLSLSGTTFEICCLDNLEIPKYNGLESYVDGTGLRHKFDIRTLHRLQREGFVASSMVLHYGIPWEAFYLTKTGKLHLKLIIKTTDG